MNPNAICPHCGEKLPPILDAFCPVCHESLEEDSVEIPASQYAPSPAPETEMVESQGKKQASESISGSKTLGYLALISAIL